MNTNPPVKEKKPFDISVWARAIEKKRQKREQQRIETLDKVLNAIDQLSEKYKWKELYLFGSLTQPDKFSERSDIDFGIEGLDKYLHYKFISDLSGLLQRGIDVIRLEDCSFAESIKKRGIKWKKQK